jgi:hypothetical protein
MGYAKAVSIVNSSLYPIIKKPGLGKTNIAGTLSKPGIVIE